VVPASLAELSYRLDARPRSIKTCFRMLRSHLLEPGCLICPVVQEVMTSRFKVARQLIPRTARHVYLVMLWISVFGLPVFGQTEDAFSDRAADPVKLFERAQNAHARGDLASALQLYREAISVRPEFPEAEFQQGNVLVLLGDYAEAESAFRRAIALRKSWALPYTALGGLLLRNNKEKAAEEVLRQALELDRHDGLALRQLADLRLRAGDSKEALELAKRATSAKDAPLSSWIIRAMAERGLGAKAEAKASLDHVLAAEPYNIAALMERAELYLDDNNYSQALDDLKNANGIKPEDKSILARLAFAYERAGKPDEARRAAEAAGIATHKEPSGEGNIKVIGTPEEIEAANSDDPAVSRKALEKLLVKNPDNAMLLGKLGAAYRTENPTRSLELYRRASQLEPQRTEYVIGYGAALLQARRFVEAAGILRRVIHLVPGDFTAHANLATALYELKSYQEALTEYEWLLKAKPDLTVAYYFVATAHDFLGEYQQALSAYETFLTRADPKNNQLEIEKVNLRLPAVRRLIQLGKGIKKKS